MSTHTSAGVPGIPTAALDAIQDENTRIVLQSIVDGLNVRNGFSGQKGNRFITENELTQMAMNGDLHLIIKRTAQSAAASAFSKDSMLDAGELSRAANDLYAQVFESRLYKDLHARVDLIDKPGGIFERLEATETVLKEEIEQRIEDDTALSRAMQVMGVRVGLAETALQTEATQRVNADNALQESLNTQYAAVNSSMALMQSKQTTMANQAAAMATQMNQVQAQVANQAVAIKQETEARVDLEGKVYGQWTLKIQRRPVAEQGDAPMPVVTGIGLSQDNKISQFMVSADRFALVSPDGRKHSALIIHENTIYVFDNDGGLRVKLGNLSQNPR